MNRKSRRERSGSENTPQQPPTQPSPNPPAARPNLWLVLAGIVVVGGAVAGAAIVMSGGLGGGGGGGGSGGPNPVVVIDTSEGPIKVELFQDRAPITVKNFLTYVDEKSYDGTIFHRVMPNFMIQGGGFLPGMKKEKPTHDPIKNEAYNRLANERGTIAMARTGEPNSATAQFFINVKDNPGLDRENTPDGVGYAVFGKVIDGMNVVDKIRYVQTGTRRGQDDVPLEDVVIKSVRRVESEKK